MKKAKRVFLIVLDSFGIGYEPDADAFGDVGANTLLRISASEKFNIPNLLSLGLGSLDGVNFLPRTDALGAVARMREVSLGKDTTIGHWEISGIVSKRPLPTYPKGFPKEVIDEFSRRVGRGVLCNLPYSGTEVIAKYGDRHVKSGDLIVYTSADSVFQIAAHEEVVPLETLYEYCRVARELLAGEHAVGRVIARPFVGESGSYKRTANRRDFSLLPPKKTALNAISEAGLEVIGVGKIGDIFVGQGITESNPTHGNLEGMKVTEELLARDFSGLCFVNLVDFDMLYGHRQDIDGYANALSEFDSWLGGFMSKLSEDDVLMITADHGCDPGDTSTDHTREYVPLLIYGNGIKPVNLGTRIGFTEVGITAADLLGVKYSSEVGESLVPKIT
ncbi:MAG: phosphopentomutase [Clostridia bacterium]|nr:phosphopentomutase [Clostridia bacterium]